MLKTSNTRVEKTDEVAKLLNRVGEILDNQQPKDALELLARAKVASPWINNAVGVAQMRQGNPDIAVEVFRRLALGPGGLVLSDEVPAVFLTNFATALLANRNVNGCLGVLNQLDESRHPAVKKLNDAIARWTGGMTVWQRLKYRIGGSNMPVPLDFPLGDLE